MSHEGNAQVEEAKALDTWDDSESSDAETDSEDEHANLAFKATPTHDSTSESETKEVFSNLNITELEDSLSELLEIYSQLKIKYKKLKKNLVFEIEKLKAENSELKENNIKLKNDFQNAQKISSSEDASSSKNILKEFDYSFQKFLAKSIDRSKMASMIYGVSRNNRKGLGYKSPRGKEIYKPKYVDEMKMTYNPLHKQFEFGHTHNIKYMSLSESLYVKPRFKQNLRTSNQKRPRRIWVPKEKIIYVADILKGDVETPTLV